MGTVSSSLSECNSDCLEVKCCGTRGKQGLDGGDAYICDNFYSNSSIDDPCPNLQTVSTSIPRPTGLCCVKVDNFSCRKNQDCVKGCSFPSLLEAPVRNSSLTSPYQTPSFYDNCYRNQPSVVCRNVNPPFPPVEVLSVGLNNNKAFSQPAENLVHASIHGSEKSQIYSRAKLNERKKIPNNLYDPPTYPCLVPMQGGSHCRSTCSSGKCSYFIDIR